MKPSRLQGLRALAGVAALLLARAAAAGTADDIEARLRGRPAEALAAAAAALPGTQGAARIELLLLRGWMQTRIGDGAAAEATAQAIEAEAHAGPALAAGAAQLLRGRWLARSGPLGRADRALAEAESRLAAAPTPPWLRLRLVDARARVKLELGRFDEALRLYQESAALADRGPQAWQRAEQRIGLAYTLYQAQQRERAHAVNAEAIALARASGDALVQSAAMTTEGIIVGALGRKAEELAAMRAALDLARSAGARRDAALALANLSDYYIKDNNPGTALALAREALPLAREVRDPLVESVALTNAGLALVALQQRDEGVRLVREALLIEERAGALPAMVMIQQDLGQALERAGHLREAWAAHVEHRRLAGELFQREQQQAVLEAQESFDAERRQRDAAAMQTEMGLKSAQLESRNLERWLWVAGTLAGVLLLAVVGVLVRRMRRSNAALTTSNAELHRASERDPLTGLANRRRLQAAMAALPGAAAAFEGTLLLIDVDHFKRINDNFGHAAGDRALTLVAGSLLEQLRADDVPGRLGGDEFALLLRGAGVPVAIGVAERIVQAMQRRTAEQRLPRLTLSFGVVQLLGREQVDEALRRADQALFEAKRQGRGCAVAAEGDEAHPVFGESQRLGLAAA